MSEWTITVAPPNGVRDTVAAFEAAWLEADGADLNSFLPLPDDAEYTHILHELIRLDLRLSWAADRPRRLADFLDTYPVAFEDRTWVSAMALEEYRARTAGGEPIQAAHYTRQFGVDVSGWRSCRTFLRPSSDPDDPRRTAVVAVPSGHRTGGRAVPAPGLPRAGQTFLDFELIRELGRGVFGRVFLARQQELAGRPVALKVTTETDAEPQTLARLQHTNIVPIYSVARHGSLQAICMPYFGSVTLAQVIRTVSAEARLLAGNGRRFLSTLFEMRATVVDDVRQAAGAPLPDAPPAVPDEPPSLKALADMKPVQVALWIAARLADGLAHAHERGVLHCDLKPANVLLADDGQPMLLDFNVAADRQSAPRPPRLGGTLPYMAPEHLDVIAGQKGTLTPQCDIYSLGVVLYELLTGTQPFDEPPGDPARMITLYRDLHRQTPPAPSTRNPMLSPAVDAIVVKMLDPDPARRYADASQVREDLERQLTDRPLAFARDRSVAERARKWRRRHPRLSAGLIVAASALGLLVAPATVLAVRQNQLAERRHEIARSEAVVAQTQAVRDLRLAQTMLTGRSVDRSLVLDGLDRARRVLEAYHVPTEADWAARSPVALLSDRQRAELRGELGETLLMMARAEELLAPAGDAAAAAAGLRWNQLAERCYPADARPRRLATQRARLLTLAPGAADPLPDPGPTAADAYHEAVADAQNDRPADALRKLVPYTDEHPAHFLAWYARGACHERVGQFADSAAAFTVCATLSPDFAPVYFSRGHARLKQGKPADAEADFTRALERRPEWSDALLNRAIARDVQKDHAGAEADLTALLERPDAPTRAYFLRSRVRTALGNMAGAAADVAEGHARVPADEASYLTRGYWNLASSPAAALADFDAALALNPKSRDGLLNRAVVLAEHLRRPADAVTSMDRLLDLYPTYTDARAGRGVYLARLGDAKRATADAKWVLNEDPTSHRYFQMAGVYALLSKADPSHKSESLRLLTLAFRAGFNQFEKLDRDPDLEPVRKDPAFQAMVGHARKLRAQ